MQNFYTYSRVFSWTILIFISISSCKSAHSQKLESPFRDSVIEKYIYKGAWKYPIFSKEWDSCIDIGLEILPNDGFLWQQKAMPHIKRMKYEIGLDYLDNAVKNNPDKYLDYRAFVKCIFQKNYRSALNDFFRCKKDYNNYAIMDHIYEFYMGLCYLQLNYYDSAKVYFQVCITKDSVYGINWIKPVYDLYMGITQFELGDNNAALKYFDRAINNYPGFSDALFYKSQCIAASGNNEEALRLQKKALDGFRAKKTIPEHNIMYEKYPYQVNEPMLKYYIDRSQMEIHKRSR